MMKKDLSKPQPGYSALDIACQIRYNLMRLAKGIGEEYPEIFIRRLRDIRDIQSQLDIIIEEVKSYGT